jgi:predicted ATPase
MGYSEHFFIITGGPGSGKSTLIQALAAEGLPGMPEAGRAIIREQVASGGTALPWGDRMAFAERMLKMDIRSWHAAHEIDGPMLFDRGIPDTCGYLRLIGLPAPSHFEHAARTFRYHPLVFAAPPWPEIYLQDRERKQSLQEAEETYRAVTEVYSSLEYELVRLPMAPVAERVRFVLERII